MAERRWRTNYGNRYAPKKPLEERIKIPKTGITLLILLILVIVVGALGYYSYTTGSYLGILQENRTVLEEQLTGCNEELNTLSSDLSTCNENLTGMTTSLDECESEGTRLSSSLETCEGSLGVTEEDYNKCELDRKDCEIELEDFGDFLDDKDLDNLLDLDDFIDNLEDDLSDCDDDRDDWTSKYNTCNSDLSAWKNDYKTLEGTYNTTLNDYANYYCCFYNEIYGNVTHYNITAEGMPLISGGEPVCTDVTNGTIALSC